MCFILTYPPKVTAACSFQRVCSFSIALIFVKEPPGYRREVRTRYTQFTLGIYFQCRIDQLITI